MHSEYLHNEDSADPIISYYTKQLEQASILGLEHPDVATALYDLGNAYLIKFDYETSKTIHHRALMIREKSLGPDHPSTAQSLATLAHIAIRTENYTIAEELATHALLVYEKSPGVNSMEYANTLRTLSRVCEGQNRLSEAEALLQRSVLIIEQNHGPEGYETAEALYWFARFYMDIGWYEKSADVFQRLLIVGKRFIEEGAEETVDYLTNYAFVLDKLEHSKEAAEIRAWMKDVFGYLDDVSLH